MNRYSPEFAILVAGALLAFAGVLASLGHVVSALIAWAGGLALYLIGRGEIQRQLAAAIGDDEVKPGLTD